MSDREEREDRKYRKRKPSFFGTFYKAIIAIVLLLIIIVAAIVGGIFIHKAWLNRNEKEERITSYQVSERLEEASELTTEKTIYSGYIHYEEGDIPFIDKKTYSMTYTAEIEAGVNVEDIKVYESGDRVIIEMPDAEVQSVYVDPASIEFHDESFAIFNWDDKQDGVDAVKNAENDALENADTDALVKAADEHAQELIESLFQDVISNGEVVVQ